MLYLVSDILCVHTLLQCLPWFNNLDDLPLWGRWFYTCSFLLHKFFLFSFKIMEPVSLWAGFVGETDKNNENKHYLYTHKNIVIKYNGNRVCVVLKFFDLTLHLLFFPLTGTVHCVLPTIRLCSYNWSYLICFYMDQWWGCCISFGEWAEGSRAWPASPCKDQRICRCSSSKLQ